MMPRVQCKEKRVTDRESHLHLQDCTALFKKISVHHDATTLPGCQLMFAGLPNGEKQTKQNKQKLLGVMMLSFRVTALEIK